MTPGVFAVTRRIHRPVAVLCVATLLTGAATAAQDALVSPAVKAAAGRITTEQLKADLEFLASDELKGRNTPSPGFDAAAAYIEARLRRAGAKPAADQGTFRQHYVMVETRLRSEDAVLQIGDMRFAPGDGFATRSFTGDLKRGTYPAVYVAHGYAAPGVDPYGTIDVKGKIVVLHRQGAMPRGTTIQQIGRVTIGGTSPLVEAQRRGAVAVVYLGDTSLQQTAGPVIRREMDPPVPSAYAAPVMTALQLGRAATEALIAGTTLDVARLGEQASAQEYPPAFEFPKAITLDLPATATTHRPFNVVALIEGTDPKLKDEYITIESHLDGAVGTRTVDEDGIYNSADDNATGSAANLAIAEQMARTRPKRSLIFIWDSGEEQGLWGTRYFVARPPVPLDRIVAHFNIDMIGANRASGTADEKEERVTTSREVFLIGPGALSDRVSSLIDRVNDEYLDLTLNRKYDTPESEFFYPRTDAGPFLERGILTIGFTTGIHDRYHLPADEARFMDPEKMTLIARTIFATIHAVADMGERPRIEKPIPASVLRVPAGGGADR